MSSPEGIRWGPCSCGPSRPRTEGEAAASGLNDHSSAFPSPTARAAGPRGFPNEASAAQGGAQSWNLNMLHPPPG
eukprot:9100942-Pyramimonas_sp.AAC.1